MTPTASLLSKAAITRIAVLIGLISVYGGGSLADGPLPLQSGHYTDTISDDFKYVDHFIIAEEDDGAFKALLSRREDIRIKNHDTGEVITAPIRVLWWLNRIPSDCDQESPISTERVHCNISCPPAELLKFVIWQKTPNNVCVLNLGFFALTFYDTLKHKFHIDLQLSKSADYVELLKRGHQLAPKSWPAFKSELSKLRDKNEHSLTAAERELIDSVLAVNNLRDLTSFELTKKKKARFVRCYSRAASSR